MALTAARHRVLAAAAAAICATTALTACSSGSGGGNVTVDASGPLKVWARAANDSPKAYQAIFDAFTQKTGVKIEPFFTLTDFETKLTAAATAHDLPDVVINDAAQLGNMKTQGIIREIDKGKITGADKLAPGSWDSATDLTGKTYAIPFSAQANLLFIRKDWLTKLNRPVASTSAPRATASSPRRSTARRPSSRSSGSRTCSAAAPRWCSPAR